MSELFIGLIWVAVILVLSLALARYANPSRGPGETERWPPPKHPNCRSLQSGRGPWVDDEQKQAVQRFADMIAEHGIGGKPLILPKYLYDQISEMGVTLSDNIVRLEDMPADG